jgi:3-oxoacyl-[acyl-carrier protein] reductase
MKDPVFITGASRGIGRETAILFAAKGHPVIVNYLKSEDAASELCREIEKNGGSALAVRADVSDPGEVTRLFDEAEAAFGHVGILVNNAGVAHFGLLADMKDADWEKVRGVNLDGVFYCCKRAIPEMVQRKSGAIVNVTSVWGVKGASCEAGYSAAKAGVIGLTKALAKELGPSGIRVNAVAPGVIATDMNKNLTETDFAALRDETPLGRVGSALEAANCIYFLASAEAAFVTGQVLGADGGFAL